MRGCTYEFECAEHQEYGSLGWKLAGNENADPLSGMAVAHDCMEHAPGGDMGVEDELMALGASFLVRVYTRNMHSLGKNVASDLPDVLAHVWYENMPLRDPGRTTAIPIEYEIDDALEEFAREMKDRDSGYADDDSDRLDPDTLKRIRGWMRRGYRAALKRWKGVDTRSLFDEIEAAADGYLKLAENAGERLFVRFSFERGIITDERRVSVRVWMKQPWGEEY